MFVRLIVVCMDTWKNGRAAVNHIHLRKTAFKNEPKHAFKNEPKHAFKNDHLPGLAEAGPYTKNKAHRYKISKHMCIYLHISLNTPT